MRVFRFALMCVIALVMVGCEAMEDKMDNGDMGEDVCPEPLPVKPTVPLKKRPIVPTSKLPRPRVAEVSITAEGVLVVSIAEGVDMATVTITEHDTRKMITYVVDGGVLELNDISESAFDVAVEADGEVDVYTVME
jgi:hypothetical protein